LTNQINTHSCSKVGAVKSSAASIIFGKVPTSSSPNF